MNKELEALENLYHNIGNSTENYLIIKSALNRLEYLDDHGISKSYQKDINKLKAFDIIKNKKVDIIKFTEVSGDWVEYNFYAKQPEHLLDKDECDLLKEMLL